MLLIVIEYKGKVFKPLGKAAKFNRHDLDKYTSTMISFFKSER